MTDQLSALRESVEHPIDDEIIDVLSRHASKTWAQITAALKPWTHTAEEYARAMDRLVASGRAVVVGTGRIVRYCAADPNTLPKL